MDGKRDTMYAYYAGQSVLPTHGAFTSPSELEAYDRQRRRLFTDKLCLPPRLFDGARLLEFGPDAGENSLVFARWGADCTLVEPHLRAHEVIRGYFERFELTERLSALESHDLESYPLPATPAERFDVIDAEGFIYVIQPPSIWIERFSELVHEDGFVVLGAYMETFGGLLELMWKVVQARFRALTALGADGAARRLFGTKWQSIPHKRSIESWTMDVLENPFVRLRYFLEPKELCTEMARAGFRLYSSWPRYDGGLDVHWFKRELSVDEQLEHELDFIARSRLSHVFGRKHFLADLGAVSEEELRALLDDVDALVDGFDPDRAAAADARLGTLAGILSSPAVIAREEDTRRSLETVDMLRRLLGVLADGPPERIAAFCNEDRAFVDSWGMPAHLAVFRRAG